MSSKRDVLRVESQQAMKVIDTAGLQRNYKSIKILGKPSTSYWGLSGTVDFIHLRFFSMVTFKCPGCKRHFSNHRALGTHKRYCQTKITAIARKLLERRKTNMERMAREENIVNPEGEEELEIEQDDEVLDAEIPCPTSVSQSLDIYSIHSLTRGVSQSLGLFRVHHLHPDRLEGQTARYAFQNDIETSFPPILLYYLHFRMEATIHNLMQASEAQALQCRHQLHVVLAPVQVGTS
jgi:hypothetical protein